MTPVQPGTPFDELSGPQRRTVQVLAGSDDTAWTANLALMLKAAHLPSSRGELRRYAGLS